MLPVLFQPQWPTQPSVLLTKVVDPSHRRSLLISIVNVGGKGGPTLNSVVFWLSITAFQFQYGQNIER